MSLAQEKRKTSEANKKIAAELEFEDLLEEIDAAVAKGAFSITISIRHDINIKRLKDEGFSVRSICEEYTYDTIIGW